MGFPKVTKDACVRAGNWFHVSQFPNYSFNYTFLLSKWKLLRISDASEVMQWRDIGQQVSGDL